MATNLKKTLSNLTQAQAIVLVSIITVVMGGLINGYISTQQTQIPIEATATAEARKTDIALSAISQTATAQLTANQQPLTTTVPSETPETSKTISSTASTSTPDLQPATEISTIAETPTSHATSTTLPAATLSAIPSPSAATPIQTSRIPAQGIMASVTDISGTTTEWITFNVALQPDQGILRQQSCCLSAIYQRPLAIPIENEDVVYFIAIDNISEFNLSGENTVTVTLFDGTTLTGNPVPEATFTGDFDNILGTVSVPETKVQKIQFNPAETQKPSLEQLRVYITSFGYWPDELNAKAEVTLLSGNPTSFSNIALVHHAYGHWFLKESLPVKVGESAIDIDFTNFESLEFIPQESDDSNSMNLNIVLQDGRVLSGTLNRGAGIVQNTSDFESIAILGTTNYGYIHVPIQAISSMSFVH